MKKWLVICLLLFAILPANALQQLNFKGFIADEASLLSSEVKNDLNMTLWDLQKKTGADIAVVIVNSLDGKSVESTAVEIGNKYKIGSKNKNNGVVFLTALNERKMRIELANGLRDKIATYELERIRDYDILPYYKKGDYENGIVRGTYQLVDVVAQAEGVTIEHQGTCPSQTFSYSRHYDRYPWWIWPFAIIMSIISPRRRYRGYGCFRGFGGGSFGGGGGFGGSGCSGSW